MGIELPRSSALKTNTLTITPGESSRISTIIGVIRTIGNHYNYREYRQSLELSRISTISRVFENTENHWSYREYRQSAEYSRIPKIIGVIENIDNHQSYREYRQSLFNFISMYKHAYKYIFNCECCTNDHGVHMIHFSIFHNLRWKTEYTRHRWYLLCIRLFC
jgi:hypothetical protein